MKYLILISIILLLGCKKDVDIIRKQPLISFDQVIDSIKSYESFRSQSYLCASKKHHLVGYGETCSKGTTRSKSQADMELKARITELQLLSQVHFPKLNYYQNLATAMLIYNIGFNKLKKYNYDNWNIRKIFEDTLRI